MPGLLSCLECGLKREPPMYRIDAVLERKTRDYMGRPVPYEVPISACPTDSHVIIVNSPGSGEMKNGRHNRSMTLAKHLQESQVSHHDQLQRATARWPSPVALGSLFS